MDLKYTDLMVDIETLDIKASAVVVSIGAVAFDAFAPQADSRLPQPKFYKVLFIDSQIKEGRTVSGDTLCWWADQDENIREPLTENKEQGDWPESVILEFDKFCSTHVIEDARVWANSPAFDLVILRDLYRHIGDEFPFSYRQERDMRTLKEIYTLYKPIPEVTAYNKHNALDDAIVQAQLVNNCCFNLKHQLY